MSNESNHWKEMFNELDTIDGWYREKYEDERKGKDTEYLQEIEDTKNG